MNISFILRSLEFWSISSYFIVICNKMGIRIASTQNKLKARASLLYILQNGVAVQTSLTRNQKTLILHEAAATENKQQPPPLFLVQVSISGPNDFKRLSERGINLGPACAARGHKKRLVSKMMNLV